MLGVTGESLLGIIGESLLGITVESLLGIMKLQLSGIGFSCLIIYTYWNGPLTGFWFENGVLLFTL